MPPNRVHLCGEVVVELGDRRLEGPGVGHQVRTLFAFLVLHAGRPVRRDELIEALWPDAKPKSPENALSTLVHRTRRALGEHVLTGRSEIRLVLPADTWVDVEAILAHLERAELAVERADWVAAQAAASTVVEIVDRGALPQMSGSWVVLERDRLEGARLCALECLGAAGIGVGGKGVADAERAARALILAAPFRETGYRYLMQALAKAGRGAEAVRAYNELCALLSDELGLPPSPALRDLHQELLLDARTRLL